MTLFHHVFSRFALLLIGLWAGGGLVLVSYCAVRWERRPKTPGTTAAMQFPDYLRAPATRKPVERATPPVAGNFPQRSEPVPRHGLRTRPLRTSSVLQLDHPPERDLVSVVIPTHNRSHIIGQAIESALAQTYHRIQVIIADDGSSDDTRSVAESYGERVTYVRQANAGVSAARNLGLRHARGEFIAFLDSDDAWLPWKIEAEVTALTRHAEAGVVWTDMQAVDDTGHLVHARHLRMMYTAYAKVDIEKTMPQVDTLGNLTANAPPDLASAAVREGDLYSAILLGNLIHTSTVLFRRAWFQKTGGFDESFARAGEDYEFYVRLCSAGPAVFIDAPSTVYRVGAADQLTRPAMDLEIAQNNLRAVQKWIPRSAQQLTLSQEMLRRRFAESFAWVGQAELDAGHRWRAAGRLAKSLSMMPRLDRRTVLLAKCAIPDKALQGFRSARRAIRANSTGRPANGLAT